jgi:hypothetical protein
MRRFGTTRLLGSWLVVLDHARANLDQALSDRRELGAGERARLRDRSAHAMHQRERSGVESEPHLISGRAVTRHAIRRQLCFVQLDQVLHPPALAVDVLGEVLLRRPSEGCDDVADVDLLAHAGLSGHRLQRAFEPSHHFARPSPGAGMVHEARKRVQLGPASPQNGSAYYRRSPPPWRRARHCRRDRRYWVSLRSAQSIASTRP